MGGFVCGTCMYVYELTLVYSEYQHMLIQTHTHTQDGGELFVGAVCMYMNLVNFVLSSSRRFCSLWKHHSESCVLSRVG